MSVCDDKILKLKERIDSELPIYSRAQVKRVREVTLSSSLKRAPGATPAIRPDPVRLFTKQAHKPALHPVLEPPTPASICERKTTRQEHETAKTSERPREATGPRLVWGEQKAKAQEGLTGGWGKGVREMQAKRSGSARQQARNKLTRVSGEGKENQAGKDAVLRRTRQEALISNKDNSIFQTIEAKQVRLTFLINLNT